MRVVRNDERHVKQSRVQDGRKHEEPGTANVYDVRLELPQVHEEPDGESQREQERRRSVQRESESGDVLALRSVVKLRAVGVGRDNEHFVAGTSQRSNQLQESVLHARDVAERRRLNNHGNAPCGRFQQAVFVDFHCRFRGSLYRFQRKRWCRSPVVDNTAGVVLSSTRHPRDL